MAHDGAGQRRPQIPEPERIGVRFGATGPDPARQRHRIIAPRLQRRRLEQPIRQRGTLISQNLPDQPGHAIRYSGNIVRAKGFGRTGTIQPFQNGKKRLADAGDPAVPVGFRQTPAHVEASRINDPAGTEYRIVGSPAADVDVQDRTAPRLGKRRRTRAPPRNDGFQMRARRGHDKISEAVRQTHDRAPGVHGLEALARHNDRARLHLFRAYPRLRIPAPDKDVERRLIERLHVRERREGHRALPDDPAIRNFKTRNLTGRRPVAQFQTGKHKLRRARPNINADAEDLLAVHCLSPRGSYGPQAPVARLHQQHERVNRAAQPVQKLQNVRAFQRAVLLAESKRSRHFRFTDDRPQPVE